MNQCDRELLDEYIKMGLFSRTQISRELKINIATVSKRVKELKIDLPYAQKLRSSKLTKDCNLNDLDDLILSGKFTLTEIKSKTGCSASTIRKHKNKLGIELPDQRNRRKYLTLT